MTATPKPQPSFSPGRRWKIGFDVVVRTALVLAVVVMVNYLGGVFTERFYLSSQTRIKISPRTVDVLRSMTNHVTVTLYYDTQDDFYPTILSLLNAYHAVNPNISIRTVDYVRDAGEAEKIKAQYKLNSPTDKNLIIFDCGGGRLPKIVPGDALAKYTLEQVPKRKGTRIPEKAGRVPRRNDVHVHVARARKFQAVQGLFSSGPRRAVARPTAATAGYLKFAAVLAQNYIQLKPLDLFGDNPVPDGLQSAHHRRAPDPVFKPRTAKN